MNLESFLDKAEKPLVVVSTLLAKDKEAVIAFILKLNAPVYLEGISGIREDPRLQPLRISNIQTLWDTASSCGYSIDGILRIGGVPTFRPWRDLEDMKDQISVCSMSHLPFSGLSWSGVTHVSLPHFFTSFSLERQYDVSTFQEWLERDREYHQKLLDLFEKEPHAEPSLFYSLSKRIPESSMVYIGNSLPIREWDMAATYQAKGLKIFASRGLNGIDGQISTFLGLCQPHASNWAIMGDLTALYDMAGPWILGALPDISINLVVVNNGGGKIFSRMFPHQEFQNPHQLHFEAFADFWGIDYEAVTSTADLRADGKNRLVELLPNTAATERFWKKIPSMLFIEG